MNGFTSDCGRILVHHGDNRQVLKSLPANSVDAVVTDAPYGLSEPPTPDQLREILRTWMTGRDWEPKRKGFMGKAWDGFVPGPEVWRECHRVLKPGGHLLSFFGTRTVDLGGLAIRLAGFEVRDLIAWLYGSGFPKSHDVARAIDALDAVGPRRERALRFTSWMRSTGITAKRLNALTNSSMASHWLTAGEQPEVPTRAMFEILRSHLPAVPEWVEALVEAREVESENLKRREVIGHHDQAAQAARWRETYTGSGAAEAAAITKAYTPEAQAWEGWGTALKPALEPVVFARKPLDGTVADNVLRFGTGALNVDACRVATDDVIADTRNVALGSSGSGVYGGASTPGVYEQQEGGRWPANLVLEDAAQVLEAFPADADGSAARFFYSAKADAQDRMGSKHPTVKPVDLMAWLVRLITPPGGQVLDPFAGSGTTGVAALREGMRCILVEREADYVADIRTRLEHAAGRAPHSAQLKVRNKPAKPLGGLFADAAE